MTTNTENKIQIIELTDQKQYDDIIKMSKAVFIDIGTSWCGPCKQLTKDLHQWIDIEKKFQNVSIAKIDAEKEEFTKLCEELEISSVPTMIFFKNGKRMTYSKKVNDENKSYEYLTGYNKTLVLEVLEWLNH